MLPKLLELINELSKVAEYKINIQKSIVCFTLTTNYQKQKLRKQFHLQLHQKRIKYIGIHLTKDLKDLYSENYNTLMKKIEDDTNKWKDTPCSCIVRINIAKMTILPKEIYIQSNPCQNTKAIFHRNRTNNSKFLWKLDPE